MMSAQLLAIVEVPKEQRVQCQAPGCGHGVYKRVHVVQDGAQITVLGSDCFSRLYQGLLSTRPRYGSKDGRRLTDAERQLLIENTQRFIESLEAEHLQMLTLQAKRAATTVRQVLVQPPRRLPLGEWLNQLSPAQRASFSVIRMELRAALRAKGLNPDAPGWAVDADARIRFEAEQKSKAP